MSERRQVKTHYIISVNGTFDRCPFCDSMADRHPEDIVAHMNLLHPAHEPWVLVRYEVPGSKLYVNVAVLESKTVAKTLGYRLPEDSGDLEEAGVNE